MLLHSGLTQLLLATCVSAAYVQWQHCDDYTRDAEAAARFGPESLSASLIHANATHDRLSLLVGRSVQTSAECDRWTANITSARLDLDSLGRSSFYYPEIVATCRSYSPGSGKATLYLEAAAETNAFHTLSTFHTTLRLLSPDAEERACLQANITPQFSPSVFALLRYAPLSILLFVLLVGILRSIRPSKDVDAETDAEPTPRAVLPDVADCLQYLQFIFLTGGLSLFYPGFYQPAVSRLGWVSLFADGIVTHGRAYAGVRDGIYELNGTYGGTLGLELMTQVVGAPMTMDTWINMVILVVAIAAACAFVLQTYWYWFCPVDSNPEDNAGLRSAFTRTLRLVLSYFMLPLVALSFYQISNATHLPAYHICLAVIFIVAIIGAFAWLLFKVPTRSLGVLVFDGRKRYHAVPSASGSQHKTFVLALFTIVFVRGVAIGGLQISGRAQLAVLGVCELVLLVCIVQFQAYSTISIGTASSIARLISLACMVAFVHGVASDNVRTAVGYLVLLLHSCMLILGFFVPAAVRLGGFCTLRWNKPGPDVYGLRQLRRRPASRMDMPTRPPTQSPPPDYITDHGSSRYLGSVRGHSDNTSDFHFDPSSVSRRDFYRPPRSPRVSPPHSVDHQYGWDNRQLDTSTPPDSDSNHSIHSDSSTGCLVPSHKSSSSDSVRSDSSIPEVPNSAAEPRPLHPRWADYSFRESDLIYGTPRPPPSDQTMNPTLAPESVTSRPSIRSLSPFRFWVSSHPSVPAERGFSVIRPSRASESS